MTNRRVAIVAVVGAVLYGAACAIAATSDHASLVIAIPIAAGLSFLAAGIVACLRRPDNRTGLLMLAVGFFWGLGSLTLTSSPLLFTVGAVTQQLAFAPLGHLLLAFPTGVLASRYHRRLVSALWVVVATGPLVVALLESRPTNCDECPESLIQVAHSHAAGVAAETLYTVVALGLGIAVLAALVRKYRAAGIPLRRVLKPVYGTFALALVFLILGNGLEPVSHEAATVLEVMAVTFLALVPVGFLAGLLRSRLARGSVVRLLMELDEGTPLRTALSEALGDPSLEIAYGLDGGSRWVDPDGRGVPEPVARGSRAVTTVEHRGERVAALVHDASLDEEPELVQGVAAAAALALHSQRLQAELRNQFEFLRTLVNTAPALLVNVDLEGRILSQNSATTEASGYASDDEVRGRYFWEVFVDPENVAELQARFAAAAPAYESAEYENSFTNAKGELRVIDWRSAPVHDESGAVTSIIAGGVDITERKRSEVELRESEDRLRAVIQSSPVAIVGGGLDNRVVTWNPAAEAIFGWSQEEVLGRPAPIIGDEHRAESNRFDQEIYGGGVFSGVETTRRRRNGTNIEVEISAAPVRGSHGEIVGLMALYMDVAERKRRERELQRERDITQTLMQSIPSLVVVVDSEAMIVDSGVDEERAGVNDAFRHTFGWPDAELVHRSVLDLIDEEDAYLARMAVAAAANGVPAPERESRWRRVDGETLVIAWTATPIADVTLRKSSLVLISGIDVSERKRQEAEIRASRARIVQAADDARRVLERNLHDGAQQRLVALSVSLRLAEAKLPSDPETASSILTAAREELTHALEELRELARGIHPAVLTDRGLAAAIEGLVARTALPVEVELPEERLPPAVEAALYYVVSESLTNVAKYARATSARISVALDDEGNVLAEVADDGVGGADPQAGSGIRGLVDRVEALDGWLAVESQEGTGTRIRVLIPLREHQPAAPVDG